ncbi:hypothetical protein L1887_31331 [Cichorium endivia]|nr:hypothetical protein L1887_31331 [Cichorium endivia]
MNRIGKPLVDYLQVLAVTVTDQRIIWSYIYESPPPAAATSSHKSTVSSYSKVKTLSRTPRLDRNLPRSNHPNPRAASKRHHPAPAPTTKNISDTSQLTTIPPQPFVVTRNYHHCYPPKPPQKKEI